jgi:CubicO group peptidase (beta-lactamase class C family)
MTYWYDPERYQSVKGYAWGYAIGVRVDGMHHQVPGLSGDAGWAGFTNTWFFVDPKNEVTAVAMSQLVGTDPGAPVLTALRKGVYLALGKPEALDLDK